MRWRLYAHVDSLRVSDHTEICPVNLVKSRSYSETLQKGSRRRTRRRIDRSLRCIEPRNPLDAEPEAIGRRRVLLLLVDGG